MPGSGVSETLGCRDLTVPGTGASVSANPAVRRGGGGGAEAGGVFHSPPPLFFFSFFCVLVFAGCPGGPTSVPLNFFVDFESSRKIHGQVMTAEGTELA